MKSIAGVDAEIVRPAVMVDLDFSSGPVRVNSTDIDITYNGGAYLGVGQLGDISNISETSELQAAQVQMQLTGIPNDRIDQAINEHYQGRLVTIYIGILDTNYELTFVQIIWRGRMDTMNVEIGSTATISLIAENRLVDWDRPRIRRYNSEDQHIKYPTDKGFEFVETMADLELKWGQK